MVARTLNRIYTVSGDESSPFYDRQLSHSIGYILDNISPNARSIQELEEIVISKSNSRIETEKLLKQLKEACEDAWSKIIAFDRLVNSQTQGMTLSSYKDKRAYLEERRLALERKINENNSLIENAHESIDYNTCVTLNHTVSDSIISSNYVNLNSTSYI